MDKKIAHKLLSKRLDSYRALSYEELAQLIGQPPETGEEGGFQFEIQAFWDGRPGEDVRVVGSVDDGGLRAFFPLTDGFIKNSEGAL